MAQVGGNGEEGRAGGRASPATGAAVWRGVVARPRRNAAEVVLEAARVGGKLKKLLPAIAWRGSAQAAKANQNHIEQEV